LRSPSFDVTPSSPTAQLSERPRFCLFFRRSRVGTSANGSPHNGLPSVRLLPPKGMFPRTAPPTLDSAAERFPAATASATGSSPVGGAVRAVSGPPGSHETHSIPIRVSKGWPFGSCGWPDHESQAGADAHAPSRQSTGRPDLHETTPEGHRGQSRPPHRAAPPALPRPR